MKNRWIIATVVCAFVAIGALVALAVVWTKYRECRFNLELLQVQIGAEKIDEMP